MIQLASVAPRSWHSLSCKLLVASAMVRGRYLPDHNGQRWIGYGAGVVFLILARLSWLHYSRDMQRTRRHR